MPIIFVSKLKSESSLKRAVLDLPRSLVQGYSPLLASLNMEGSELSIRAYINRVFNAKGEVVKEYKQLTLLRLVKATLSLHIDFAQYHLRDGIPVGHFIELLLINFRIKVRGGQEFEREIPIFPNEFSVELSSEVPKDVGVLIERERKALESIGIDVETVGLLFDVGLGHVAVDLFEGLARYYMSDFEGAIKFFRKVVEGLRNYVKDVAIEGMGENRRELLEGFLSKVYQLISNFGEHSGTYGFMPEATFSKDIAIASSRYIASYLRGAPQRVFSLDLQGVNARASG